MNNKISVVMISMNEEGAIKNVLDDINHFANFPEIILVDSSDDKTPEIALSYPNVKLIRQFPPLGYGPAMMLALKSASKDVVVTLDCDNTYPADKILDLCSFVSRGEYDLVDGSRLGGWVKNMPIINYFANLFFARIASLLFFCNLKDLHSGMRVYSKKVIHGLSFNEKGPALPVELLLKPIKYGYKVKIVQIPYNLRIGKSKMNPLPSAYWTVKRIFTTRFFS